MDTRPIRTLEDPSQASPAELEDALAHWDELDASSLERLDAHPRHGLRLRVLRAAEGWLAAKAPEPATPCPPAEALYEHAGGPGSAGARDATIAAHLDECAACASLVASLATPPPLPLEWTPLDGTTLEDPVDSDLAGADEPVPERVSPWFARWYPLAAAAALLVSAFLAPRFFDSSPLADLPAAPLLRGAENARLHFPRGPVLAGNSSADVETSPGAAGATPLFELEPVEDAEAYRVEIFQHEGGAFESGRRVAVLRSKHPTLATTPLAPGHYTWRAHAAVDGLERDLGALEFEVRRVPDLRLTPAAADLETLVERIAELHAAGYLTDARALARKLPESPEKRAYLAPPRR